MTSNAASPTPRPTPVGFGWLEEREAVAVGLEADVEGGSIGEWVVSRRLVGGTAVFIFEYQFGPPGTCVWLRYVTKSIWVKGGAVLACLSRVRQSRGGLTPMPLDTSAGWTVRTSV